MRKPNLERYATVDDLLKPEAKEIVDGLARYVGETYRRTIGGKWEIRLDDPEYVYYALPQLTSFEPHPTPIAPHCLVTASADRRTGNYWRMVLENTRKRMESITGTRALRRQGGVSVQRATKRRVTQPPRANGPINEQQGTVSKTASGRDCPKTAQLGSSRDCFQNCLNCPLGGGSTRASRRNSRGCKLMNKHKCKLPVIARRPKQTDDQETAAQP